MKMREMKIDIEMLGRGRGLKRERLRQQREGQEMLKSQKN